jgi:hypothetical protein
MEKLSGRIDHERRVLILSTDRTTLELDYVACLQLEVIAMMGRQALEPPAPMGKTYCPSEGLPHLTERS